MSYTTTSTAGASVVLAKAHKVTEIAGRACDLYVTEVGPYAQGMKRRARALGTVDVVVHPFTGLNISTGVPEYGDPVTVKAQIKTEKAGRWSTTGDKTDADYGALAPEAREILYFNNATAAQPFGVIRCVTDDPARGLMFATLYTVQFIPLVASGGDPDLNIPATITPGTPRSITPAFVDITEQAVFEGNMRVKTGDAVVKFTRNQATQAELLGDNLIRITPLGGTAMDYQLWNAAQGLKAEQTYHWTAFLKRLR